ncbi:alpha/beta fold hydrolase [Actinoplanes sp. NPDC049265]|uniref:alpha/beta fold hydrolase n=1 Tax=Actinoplanes sp. NPDC049265 TaxID=3363902 RepID=UPI00370FCF04
MRTVILVHGFWHGTWCWSPVTARLAAQGVPSVAVDLDGHGLRASIPAGTITASSAAASLVEDIRLVGGGEPCVVVAHSMAGAVATAAAEQAPELFGHLVYVTAFAPVAAPVVEYFAGPENAGEMVNRLLAPEAFAVNVMRVDPGQRAAIRETFYHDVDAGTADAAIGLLTSDAPLGITTEALPITRERFGAVPHSYVVCTKDNAVPAALQQRFVRDIDAVSVAPTGVVELDTAHSPFLSHPDQLAAAIAAVTLRS